MARKDLYKKAGMMPVSDIIADRRWRRLGHVLRLANINNAKVSLTWSPEGRRRRRGRPKTTWRRTVESEWRRLCFTSWMQIEQVAKERTKWKELTCGLGTERGTVQRGRKWNEISEHLLQVEAPKFKVDQRGVRERYGLLAKAYRRKEQVGLVPQN